MMKNREIASIYIRLKKNVFSLLKLLPYDKSFSTSSNYRYTQKEVHNYKLAVILLHAELEVFFEEIAKSIIYFDEKYFFKNGRMRYNLLCLIYRIQMLKDQKIKDIFDKKLNNYINSVTSYFEEEIINKNNGIGKENIQQMFNLLGMNYIVHTPHFDSFCESSKTLTQERAGYVHKNEKHKSSISQAMIKPNIINTTVADCLKYIDNIYLDIMKYIDFDFKDFSLID